MNIKDFVDKLDQTTNDILETTKTLSFELLNLKKENSWSVLEILEHICLTDKAIFNIISQPPAELSSTNEIIGDNLLKIFLVDQRKQRRYAAPESLEPKGSIKDWQEFEKLFLFQRETLKNNLKTGKLVVDNRMYKHPYMNNITISDWLNSIIYHTQRHLEQIKDRLKEITEL